MELELGLGLAINNPVKKGLDLNNDESCVKSKRIFEDGFDYKNKEEMQMLHLQLWSTGNDDGDDEENEGQKRRAYSDPITWEEEDDEEKNQIVGWPPVTRTWRKELLIDHDHQQHQWSQVTGNINHTTFVEENTNGSNNSMYVKVKMEGVAIVRKIDLKLYHSYQTLKDSLITMFDQCYNKHVHYTLTYQDKQGDWLLAGDVPWQSFIKSAHRLQIIRSTMEPDLG